MIHMHLIEMLLIFMGEFFVGNLLQINIVFGDDSCIDGVYLPYQVSNSQCKFMW